MTHQTPLNVHYCGPIAEPNKPARGGYESANRRLIDDIRGYGLEVAEYPYAPERRTLWGKLWAYSSGFTKLAFKIALNTSSNSIFHVTPLRDRFSLPEALLCAVAKMRKAKIVVDMRAGTLKRDLASPHIGRRAALNWMIRNADLLAYEGLEYQGLLSPFKRNSLYLPNYVEHLGPLTAPPTDRVQLAFVGRVVPEKGIETVIDCLRALLALGIDAELRIIGTGEAQYLTRLQTHSVNLPVRWHGAVPPQQVPDYLRGAHFFVFPTRHYGEGHSNALTEAMSLGLIPLVADNGFNATIVGKTGAVLPQAADGAAYAGVVDAILKQGNWATLSHLARQRIADHFSRDAVVPALIDHYQKLLS